MSKRPNLQLVLLMVLALTPIACNLSDEIKTTYVPQPTATVADSEAGLPLVYYYFVALDSGNYPAGSVTIVPDQIVLGPNLSATPRSTDPAVNIQGALQALVDDPRNLWEGEVSIGSVTVVDGQATVALTGEIRGVGDVVLVAARLQIVLTVFTEATVQSAVITLNGDNIANLGISHSSEAQAADYAYSRAEIETFISENPYPA